MGKDSSKARAAVKREWLGVVLSVGLGFVALGYATLVLLTLME